MNYKKIIAFYSILLLVVISTDSLISIESGTGCLPPTVKIDIDPNTTIYEGDIINCTITGDPIFKYWSINNQSHHTTFYEDDPVIFDPEPTPLDTDYVTLTVYTENAFGNASDSVQISVKRIYFGDIHWHSICSDGIYPLKTMYKNAKEDNYLDFVGSTDHAELRFCDKKYFYPFAWHRIKNLARKHYLPGNFTTLLAYEYTGGKIKIYNIQLPLMGDTSHINFYYKDVYPYTLRYSSEIKRTYDAILSSMSKEWNARHYNIGFFHHPLAGNMIILRCISTDKLSVNYYVNWTNFINKMKNDDFRRNALKVIRGVETYSRWGTAIGKYSNIPVNWQYNQNLTTYDHPDCWVENAFWEWSESIYTRGHPFVLQASSDTHFFNRPGSADMSKKENIALQNPSGIIAAFAVHNTRDEIWDAMNNCSIYGTQLLKIRANVRVDGQMALGQWINCTSNDTNPLKTRISAMSTFPGEDNGDKNMCPHGYFPEELDYPIQDIWLLKKDRDRGRPWCKIVSHWELNENIVVVDFEDPDVQPNDFYWVAIRQKGQELIDGENEYMAFIGPVFINNVV